MKRIFALFAVILISAETHCQTYLEKRYTAPTLAIKVGLGHSSFRYSDHNMQSMPHNIFVNPNIGACLDIYLDDNLFVAPELSLYTRGHLSEYLYEELFSVSYMVRARYIAARIPVYYRFSKPYRMDRCPFLVVAPSYCRLLGGNICLNQPGLSVSEVRIDIGNANMRPYDFCLFLGCGYQRFFNCGDFSVVLKAEMGYNWGLANTFSDLEMQEISHGMNTNAYNITGTRKINSVEFNVAIGIPLRFSNSNACWGY